VLGNYISDHVMIGKGGQTPAAFSEAVAAAGVDSTASSQDPYDLGVYSMYIPGFSGGRGDDAHSTGGYGIQCEATPRRWRMLAFGQMTPHYENRITLNPGMKDAWGIPVAHIDVRHRDDERDLAARMHASMDWIAGRVGFAAMEGGGRVARGAQALIFKSLRSMVFQESGAFHPGASIHETGGARMGTDPRGSVVNPYCQCWDVPNVYVTDGACFPSLGYQNHTLTIMALTVRACEYLLRQQGR
jgi:choline dehydrogenase-like flavoprotein